LTSLNETLLEVSKYAYNGASVSIHLVQQQGGKGAVTSHLICVVFRRHTLTVLTAELVCCTNFLEVICFNYDGDTHNKTTDLLAHRTNYAVLQLFWCKFLRNPEILFKMPRRLVTSRQCNDTQTNS
jgi:hypothetical protein